MFSLVPLAFTPHVDEAVTAASSTSFIVTSARMHNV
jgi:hypothetical protein